MGDSESNECPCSNIAIMQLFHELKQKFPKIPDQIVSKVIEQNFHNKTACEMILEKESHHYLQSYPGALISGAPRDQSDPLCKQCSAPRPTHPQRPVSSSATEGERREEFPVPATRWKNIRDNFDRSKSFDNPDCADGVGECTDKCGCRKSHSECAKRGTSSRVAERDVSSCHWERFPTRSRSAKGDGEENLDQMLNSSSSSLGTYLGSFTGEEEEEQERRDASSESSAVITDRTSESGCDSETKEENFIRSQSSIGSSSLKSCVGRGIETCRWSVEDGGRKSAVVSGIISSSTSPSESPATHNYQVNLKCSMQPIPLDSSLNRDQTRSFTSVNLCLRPPSSEPQPPIEIQSGQSLTYTTSSFDPKKGYQSQLQIRIDPALLEKQKERRDLLAIELRREKEKLRFMQNEVRLMQVAIARRPNPEILPKLKSEILRLRAECEKLTAAVDLYNENAVPLGETNEEFYRNIYTGQRFQREDSWSCQLCKFRNHPLLTICEVCEMPRLSLGTSVRDVTSHLSNVCSNTNNPSLRTGAETSTSASLIIAPLQERSTVG